MTHKEKNYVSAVIYLGEERQHAYAFLTALNQTLSSRFENYELIFVEDASCDDTEGEVRRFLEELSQKPPVSMIHLSLKQGLELAMNAGLDAAVGDFVYEFDTMEMPYDASLINEAYDSCIEGNDIVRVSPQKNRSFSTSLFYRLFNSASGSKYSLRTDVFRLLSRRAVNRVHSLSPTMPYRKAAYASCGLRMHTLLYEGKLSAGTQKLRFSRASDSLMLYTSLAYKVSIIIALVMLLFMVGAVVYIAVVFFGGFVEPAPGWTTTMLMMTGGFFGVFVLFAFVLKYLSLLVEMTFNRQKYLVESVEKIV